MDAASKAKASPHGTTGSRLKAAKILNSHATQNHRACRTEMRQPGHFTPE
jgi:hypothetical protein